MSVVVAVGVAVCVGDVVHVAVGRTVGGRAGK
jgi:hypothetical protein